MIEGLEFGVRSLGFGAKRDNRTRTRLSPFIVRRSPFAVRRSPFAVIKVPLICANL